MNRRDAKTDDAPGPGAREAPARRPVGVDQPVTADVDWVADVKRWYFGSVDEDEDGPAPAPDAGPVARPFRESAAGTSDEAKAQRPDEPAARAPIPGRER